MRYIYTTLLIFFSAVTYGDVIDDLLPELKVQAPKDKELFNIGQLTKEQFKPVTSDDVSSAKGKMIASSQRLESFLKSNASQWFEVLQWNPNSDTKELYQSLRHINWGYEGLELPEFRDLADSIKKYIDYATAFNLKDQTNAYLLQTELLVDNLENYNPINDDLESEICRRLRFIESFDRAPDLVSLILTRYVKPNAYISVSPRLADDFSKSDNRLERITDNILGTRLTIDTKTSTNTKIKPIPSQDSAAFQVIVNGATDSDSVGFNGPAVIRSSALTRFVATQSIYLTDDDIKASRPQASATTSSVIHSVTKNGGGLGSRIVARKGTQQARAKQGQSNAIAADHAESRAEQRLGIEISKRITDLRKRYNDKVHGALLRYGLVAEIGYKTTDEYVTSIITESDYGQLGASTDPEKPQKHHDFVVSLHRSMINNVLESFLSGAIIKESKVGQRPTIDAPIPEKLADLLIPRYDTIIENPNYKPWTLELASFRPVTVNFDNGLIQITVHAASIISGRDTFNNWDITQTMKPNIQKDGSVVATQSGDLVILPTGFDHKHDRLTTEEVSLRSALTKVINERTKSGVGFTTKIEIPTITPEKLGKLSITEIIISNGWAVIGWDRDVAKK